MLRDIEGDWQTVIQNDSTAINTTAIDKARAFDKD